MVQVYSNVKLRDSADKPLRSGRDIGPLFPFEELWNEDEISDAICKQEEDSKEHLPSDCSLPDPRALLNVTSRRKVPPRKRNSFVVCTVPSP